MSREALAWLRGHVIVAGLLPIAVVVAVEC